MSDDLAPGLLQTQLSSEEILALAREVIAKEAKRDAIRRNAHDLAQIGSQRPGVTLDLGHQKLVVLPDEIIDIIKDVIERLAECKQLRYLNARFNRFVDIPKPVLDLENLEILDLSRNRLRYIPDEISQMSALKVFALQRNKLERLPTTMADMQSLRVLKVDENPLIFPPPEIWKDKDGNAYEDNAAREKAMLQITARIKKYLKQHESESTDDERQSENAETPRPIRPSAGTRFPVRPSLNGIDSSVTSPDGTPPPPIPNRSHERVKSTQPKTSSLLSPPDPATMEGRSKRHGMLTPRGLETAALSPTALQEAFGGGFSAPHSRTTSTVSTSSVTSNTILDTSKLVYTIASALYTRLHSMRPVLEWQNQTTLKSQVDTDLRTASVCIKLLGKALRRSQADASLVNPGYLFRPVIECLRCVSQFSKCLGQCSIAFTRASDYDKYRGTFWDIQKETWDLYIANTKLHNAIRSANHSRQTSTSSHAKQLSYERPNIAAALGHSRNVPSRNAFSSSSPNRSHRSQGSTTSNPFSPPVHPTQYVPPVPNLQMDLYSDETAQDPEIDALWNGFYQSLKNLCDRATEGLPKILRHYYAHRQQVMARHEHESDQVRQLGSLVARSSNLNDVAVRLSARLNSVTPSDKGIRQSMEFWQLCRTIILEWHGYVDKTRSLSAVPSYTHSEIKPVMKSIHVAMKDATTRLTNSPWANYLNQSNYDGSQSRMANYPPPTPSLTPVPSTPMSAALGPAAIATLPSRSQPSKTSLNVFERAEKATAFPPTQSQDFSYGRKA